MSNSWNSLGPDLFCVMYLLFLLLNCRQEVHSEIFFKTETLACCLKVSVLLVLQAFCKHSRSMITGVIGRLVFKIEQIFAKERYASLPAWQKMLKRMWHYTVKTNKFCRTAVWVPAWLGNRAGEFPVSRGGLPTLAMWAKKHLEPI